MATCLLLPSPHGHYTAEAISLSSPCTVDPPGGRQCYSSLRTTQQCEQSSPLPIVSWTTWPRCRSSSPPPAGRPGYAQTTRTGSDGRSALPATFHRDGAHRHRRQHPLASGFDCWRLILHEAVHGSYWSEGPNAWKPAPWGAGFQLSARLLAIFRVIRVSSNRLASS